MPRHRPRTVVASLCLATVALLGTATGASAGTWPVPTSTDSARDVSTLSSAQLEDQLMVEINAARAANGLAEIRVYDACTDRMSERWGRRIARTGVFAHRDQGDVVDRCRGTWAGETLVRGGGLTPDEMVRLWLDSPGHREILLSRRADRAGVAITRDGQGRTVGVVNLLRHR